MATELNSYDWIPTSKNPETGKTEKFTCPRCGQKRFRRYWIKSLREWASPEFGICDRVNGCGYELRPTANDVFGERHRVSGLASRKGLTASRPTPSAPPTQRPETCNFSFMSDLMDAASAPPPTLQKYLCDTLGAEAASVCGDYLLTGYPGRGSEWACFWYTNGTAPGTGGKVSDGRLIAYDDDGHRRHDNYSADWHRAIKARNGDTTTPAHTPKFLFGLHTAIQGARVLIVESEKTAIVVEAAQRAGIRPRLYDSVMATGGATYLRTALLNSASELRRLGCSVTLSPDNDEPGRKWMESASELSRITKLSISIDTETTSDGIPDSWDLADIILHRVTTSTPTPPDTIRAVTATCETIRERPQTGQIKEIASDVMRHTIGTGNPSDLGDLLQSFGFARDYKPHPVWSELEDFLF